MKKRLSFVIMLLVVVVFSFSLLSACGNPYRDECRDACTKMFDCDSTDNGGSGALTAAWLTSCQNSCDEADEIDDTKAKCIIETACENLTDCGTGATTL